MSSFVKSVKRSGGLIFLQFVEKKGPQARLTDLTNLTSHFPGPGKKVPDPIPGSSEGAPLGLLVARRVGPEDCQVCQICQTAPGLFSFKMSPRWEDCQLCQIWQTVLGGCFSSNCHKKRECQVLSNPSSDSEACLSSNCHTKGLWRRMSSFVKSVKRSGGLIFLQFRNGPQARLTDLTNLTSHFPGPGKKVPDPIPGSSEFRRGTAGAPRPSA